MPAFETQCPLCDCWYYAVKGTPLEESCLPCTWTSATGYVQEIYEDRVVFKFDECGGEREYFLEDPVDEQERVRFNPQTGRLITARNP